MSGKSYTEEIKIKVIKQITDGYTARPELSLIIRKDLSISFRLIEGCLKKEA